MIEEFEVITEKSWLEEIYKKIEGNNYLTEKFDELQEKEQQENPEPKNGILNILKEYITRKVMNWGGIELIDDEKTNISGYGNLLNTYLQIGDRCVPIRHYDDKHNLGLQIMNSPEEKKEFVDQHKYEQMKNFV